MQAVTLESHFVQQAALETFVKRPCIKLLMERIDVPNEALEHRVSLTMWTADPFIVCVWQLITNARVFITELISKGMYMHMSSVPLIDVIAMALS